MKCDVLCALSREVLYHPLLDCTVSFFQLICRVSVPGTLVLQVVRNFMVQGNTTTVLLCGGYYCPDSICAGNNGACYRYCERNSLDFYSNSFLLGKKHWWGLDGG